MFLLLYARDFYLPCIKELNVNFLELILDAQPINENKTVVKCAFFILFHFQDIFFTHTNVHFSHVLEDYSSGGVINLIEYGCGFISIYLFEIAFEFLDLLLFGEIELDLLFDDTLSVIVIGNHRQIPKEREQVDGLV
jgi:hypothetical protein